MKYFLSIIITIALLFSSMGFFIGVDTTNVALAYSGYPTFSIVSVVKDKSVTIRTNNFPANDNFKILMNYMGTRGINGIKVGSISSGSGGSFSATFNIPSKLKGEYQISIRLQSTTGSGYYAYNWFYNNTGKSTTKSIYGISVNNNFVIRITKVVKDKSITFTAYNLPVKDAFKILIYKSGTKITNADRVGEFSTGDGHTRTFTVEIPASLKGKSILYLRLQNLTGSGLYSETSFYNK